jgi:lipid-binding SYLF domain-containing protein
MIARPIRLSRIVLRPFSSILVLLLSYSAISIPAQKIEADQLKKAIQRSESAANILSGIVNVSNKGIPIELIEKAEAIAVFPHVVKAKLLLEQLTIGYGVISRRLPGGWSQPAFYSLRGAGIELNIVGGESADIVLLFMNDATVNLFQKGRVELKGQTKAVSGPVGTMTVDQSKEISYANIIGYAVSKGQLIGVSIKSDLLKGFFINPDNNLNKALYGLKGRDVLAGKPINAQPVPASTSAFSQALTRYSSR